MVWNKHFATFSMELSVAIYHNHPSKVAKAIRTKSPRHRLKHIKLFETIDIVFLKYFLFSQNKNMSSFVNPISGFKRDAYDHETCYKLSLFVTTFMFKCIVFKASELLKVLNSKKGYFSTIL